MVRLLTRNLNTIIYLLLILLSLWISYLIIYGKGGIVKRKSLEAEIVTLQREINDLQEESDFLDVVLHHFTDNTRYLEGYARELGYRRESETIYKFIERDRKAATEDRTTDRPASSEPSPPPHP
jgi:cell division protein FtsB